jgi:hypothetical protein
LFGESAVPVLRRAAAELFWLLDRGYPPVATLKLVGDRHRLRQRQRVALGRCSCTAEQAARRSEKQLDLGDLRGKQLFLDGYNVLTTLEAAMGGSVVLAARDGCYRDMASMHGTYRKVTETLPALTTVGESLVEFGVRAAKWFLDSPVSNSGRLATLMRDLAAQRGWPWEIELVADPDVVLAKAGAAAATADSAVLDRCGCWFNLARLVIDRAVARVWIVDLSQPSAGDA